MKNELLSFAVPENNPYEDILIEFIDRYKSLFDILEIEGIKLDVGYSSDRSRIIIHPKDDILSASQASRVLRLFESAQMNNG